MKYAEQNFVFKQVSYKYVFNVFWVGRERGWGGVGDYSRWVLIRGWQIWYFSAGW